MATDPMQLGYSEIAAEAEAAVAAVKDPELRRIAFEKILATLLTAASTRPRRALRKSSGLGGGGSQATGGSQARSRPRGPLPLLKELITEGFFEVQRTISDVKAELANRGHHIPLTRLSTPLQRLTQQRKLRRQKVKPDEKASKATFAYSNW